MTSRLREIAEHNRRLDGIIDRVDFNATTHGVRDLEDDRLGKLIEKISEKRLGLKDVEADIIGRSYEYLIRKFAEGSGQSAGEFYTPAEVGQIMARIMDAEPGMEIYDPCCGSSGLLIKCELAMQEKMALRSKGRYAPLKLFGQEYIPGTWAMANMNMIIHDMEGQIELGDTFKSPKFRQRGKLRTFDRVVTNPMWNQDWWSENDYDADEFGRFPAGAGFPGKQSADWGWAQHVLASLNENGRAAVVLDTGAASRGSGNANKNKEKQVRAWFVDNDLIEGVIYLPENLFYNTSAPGILLMLNRAKPAGRKGKLLLVNASRVFAKGDPKNYIPEEGIECIVATYSGWKEKDKFSRIVERAEIVKNDYNISPSRYIHTADSEEHRTVREIIEDLSITRKESQALQDGSEPIHRKLLMAVSNQASREGLRAHWKLVEFDEFATLQRGKDLTKAQFKEGTVPVAGSNGIIGYHNEASVRGPGVTVGRSGSVGKVTYYDTDFWAHNTALYVKDFHGNHPRFVAYYLKQLDLARFKTRASVPTLDRNSFRRYLVAVPPYGEQETIARVLRLIELRRASAASEEELLNELVNAVSALAFSSQMPVSEADLTDLITLGIDVD